MCFHYIYESYKNKNRPKNLNSVIFMKGPISQNNKFSLKTNKKKHNKSLSGIFSEENYKTYSIT